MTDKQMAKLLVQFNHIEELMDKRGAKGTSFSDKIKSFDSFDKKPKNPGNIGYKFYLENNIYNIKPQYKNDKGITKELNEYKKYKNYKKQRRTVLHGNYNTLIKIGHERNQLMHIYNYEIHNYEKFVKICQSMIHYLENPEKKQRGGYAKFDFFDNRKPEEETIVGRTLDILFKKKYQIRPIKDYKLHFKRRSKYIMFDNILDSIINMKVIIMFLIVMVGLIVLKYAVSNGVLPAVYISMEVYFFIAVLFYIIVHNYKKVLHLIGLFSIKTSKMAYKGFTDFLLVILALVVNAVPYMIVLALIYYFVIGVR